MRREQLTTMDLMRKIDESGKHRTKAISESRNGRVEEHFEGDRSVGFTFYYRDGHHETTR